MELLTGYQANRTTVGVGAVRRLLLEPQMKSLTFCQANRTRVGVSNVRRHPPGD